MDTQLIPRLFTMPSPLLGVSKADLFKLAEQRRFEDEILQHVAKLGREAVDKAIMLGLAAYDARYANPEWTIDKVRHLLTSEPFDVDLQLVRFAPTGKAFMIIGEPGWPEGEWTDLGSVKIEVRYELIKAEDRKYFGSINSVYPY